jgi:hypothetical protein
MDNNLDFLLDRFDWYNQEERILKSKKKWIGGSTGDDSTLYIYLDDRTTNIWWKSNRGEESTIFDGKELKTEKEFEQLFDWLEIKIYLKW